MSLPDPELVPLDCFEDDLRRRLQGRRIEILAWRRGEHAFPVLELDGWRAFTARVFPTLGTEDDPWAFKGARNDRKFWETWSKLLSAIGLLSPALADHACLRELERDARRLRFCCDTSALANGIAHWALQRFPGRADLVTSTLVEREVMAWAERDGEAWRLDNVKQWHAFTRNNLARRLIEYPPPGVVVDRLAPEQAALVLAKWRDDRHRDGGATEGKSPDADMLILELARDLLRLQPTNARVVFLCADFNLARTATNVLGHEAVFFAHPGHGAKEVLGKVLCRGSWFSYGTHGSIHSPPLSEALWSLLAAYHALIIRDHNGADSKAWKLSHARTGQRTMPSELARPHLRVEALPWELEGEVGTPPTPTGATPTELVSPSPPAAAEAPRVEGATLLLTRSEPRELAEGVSQPKFGVAPFFHALWSLCNGSLLDALPNELHRSLRALGAVDATLAPGPRLAAFKAIWRDNDLDALHAELQAIPSYRDVVAWVREHHGAAALPPDYKDRKLSVLRLAGALGQVAEFAGAWYVGDEGLSAEALLSMLDHLIPPGASASAHAIYHAGLRELRVGPLRLQAALKRLWQEGLQRGYTADAGGTVEETSPDTVSLVHLYPTGFELIPFVPTALDLGGRPVRGLTR